MIASMQLHSDTPAVAIQVSRDLVVASIQVQLDDDVLARFQDDLLQRVHGSESRGVILDLSGLEILDSHELDALRRIINMVAIMGIETVLVGLRPGVVSALMEAGADVDGLCAAINLDAAFDMFEARAAARAQSETGGEPVDSIAPAQPAPVVSGD